MNKADKARITYRFDGQGRKEAKPLERKQESQVIPLYREEFEVVDAGEEKPGAQTIRDTDGAARSGEIHSAAVRSGHGNGTGNGNVGERRREPVVLNEFRTDFGAYRSPFDEETERVERIIRDSQKVNGETGYIEDLSGRDAARRTAGAAAAAGGYESGHSEPYREPFANGYEGYRFDERGADGRAARDERGAYHWDVPQLGARYARSSSTPPWTRIVLSVTGAVVTGVVFGFLVLSMFTDNPLPIGLFGDGKAKVPAVSQSATGSAAGGGATAGTGGATAGATAVPGQADKAGAAAAAVSSVSTGAGGGVVAVNLPARSYSFLQNGIFSSPAAAQSAEAELKKKGYAVAEDTSDKTTVYAGFALQKDEATQLAGKLKGDKLDVFVKSVDVPAAPKLRWNGKASAGELSSYFQQGDKLVQMIGSLTTLHLAETKPSAIEPATLDAIKSTHQTWLGSATPVKADAADTAAPKLQLMATALNTAVLSMDEYRKNPSGAYLWQAQSGLMQYVLAEKSILTDLAAQ